MISVLIADDHQLFRQGLASMLKAFSQLKVVGQAAHGAEALELIAEYLPDVVLLDIEMPEVDGFMVLKKLRKSNLNTKVLVLTMHHSATFIKNIVNKRIQKVQQWKWCFCLSLKLHLIS